jgi:hypothetical protein
MIDPWKATIEARRLRLAEADAAVAQADEILNRRLLGTIRFSSSLQALSWYFEQSTVRNCARSPKLDCDRDYQSVKASVPCKAGRQQDPDEAFVVLSSIHALFNRWAAGQLRDRARKPGIPYTIKALAVALVLRDGKTEEQAAWQVADEMEKAGLPEERWGRLCQQTVSRWIGECEEAIAGPLIEAGIVT